LDGLEWRALVFSVRCAILSSRCVVSVYNCGLTLFCWRSI